MGFLNFLFNRPRSGGYGRLVAWVEKRYGAIPPNASAEEAREKFSRALSEESRRKDSKAVAGLRKYVEGEKYLGLVKKK